MTPAPAMLPPPRYIRRPDDSLAAFRERQAQRLRDAQGPDATFRRLMRAYAARRASAQ